MGNSSMCPAHTTSSHTSPRPFSSSHPPYDRTNTSMCDDDVSIVTTTRTTRSEWIELPAWCSPDPIISENHVKLIVLSYRLATDDNFHYDVDASEEKSIADEISSMSKEQSKKTPKIGPMVEGFGMTSLPVTVHRIKEEKQENDNNDEEKTLDDDHVTELGGGNNQNNGNSHKIIKGSPRSRSHHLSKRTHPTSPLHQPSIPHSDLSSTSSSSNDATDRRSGKSRRVLFYDYFLKQWSLQDPNVMLVFRTMQDPIKIISRMINFFVQNCAHFDSGKTLRQIQRISNIHNHQNVAFHSYDSLARTLLLSLRHMLGAKWTADMHIAWTMAFSKFFLLSFPLLTAQRKTQINVMNTETESA